MRKKKEEKKEEKKENSLKEFCGDDAELYDCLRNYLYENPLAAISKKDLDILTVEAEKSGKFRPAVDKAIFEAVQNPGERERYVKVVQSLASKTLLAMGQEKQKAEKEGSVDRAASLEKRIEYQELMINRTEDILNVASQFYNEKLVEQGEIERRGTREKERQGTEMQGTRIEKREEALRQGRKKERKKMGRAEKKEAKKQDKIEGLEAAERKEAREEKKQEIKMEEKSIEETEKAGREARKKERSGN